MNLREVATRCDVAPRVVLNWVAKGTLNSTVVRRGMRNRYDVTMEDLKDFCTKHKVTLLSTKEVLEDTSLLLTAEIAFMEMGQPSSES